MFRPTLSAANPSTCKCVPPPPPPPPPPKKKKKKKKNGHAQTFANIAKRLFVHWSLYDLEQLRLDKVASQKNVTIYWSFRMPLFPVLHFCAHAWTFVTRNAHCQTTSIFTSAVNPMGQDQVASQNTSQYILQWPPPIRPLRPRYSVILL